MAVPDYTEHSRFSASASGRWLACPGSIQQTEALPKELRDRKSAAASEGTMAHTVAETALSDSCSVESAYGWLHSHKDKKTKKPFIDKEVLKEEDIHHIETYVEYVRSYDMGDRSHATYEARVDYSHIIEGGFGTLDALVYDMDTDTLHIFDLKFGGGILVDAVENSQMMLYAAGAYNLYSIYEPKTIKAHIVQPRRQNAPRCWELSIERLKEFEAYASERAKLAAGKKPPLIAGEDQCRWCPAAKAATCPEAQDKVKGLLAKMSAVSAEPAFSDDGNLPILSDILMAEKFITGFLDNVRALFHSRIEAGIEVPGWMLKDGKGRSAWIDEEEANEWLEERFGEAAYEEVRKYLGITKARTLIKKTLSGEERKEVEEGLNALIHVPPGKKVLVPGNEPGDLSKLLAKFAQVELD